MIVYASIKTLQIKLLLPSAAKYFALRDISHIKYVTQVSEVSTAIKFSISMPNI